MIGNKKEVMNEFIVNLTVRVRGFSKEQVEKVEKLRHDEDVIDKLEVEEVSDGKE